MPQTDVQVLLVVGVAAISELWQFCPWIRRELVGLEHERDLVVWIDRLDQIVLVLQAEGKVAGVKQRYFGLVNEW